MAKAKVVDTDSWDDGDDSGKTLIIDADTMVVKAAIMQQENYVIVTHKKSGKKKEFENKTQFWGHWKKREGGWLATQNLEREEKGKKPFSPDDFDVEELSRVIGSVDEGVESFDFQLGQCRKATGTKDYIIFLEGQGNFRDDEAHIQEYKGNREGKPILMAEIKEEIIYKYRNKIVFAEGIETDDNVAMYAHKGYLEEKSTGDNPYIMCYVDKDLLQVGYCNHFNYGKPELGINKFSPKEAFQELMIQMIIGDDTDNIPKLPTISSKLKDKWELKKIRGLGKATAQAILKPCKTTSEMFERVRDCYIDNYGREKFDFTSWRGEESKRTYVDMMQEVGTLLYMRRHEEDRFDIRKLAKRLKVEL